MNTDSSLTILLALKDGVPFTLRWMRYANHIRLPFKVLIADGGADERVPKILSNRANYPSVNYEYVRYPYDETYSHYYAKLVDALARVETPFVVLADNDDFYVVDGLARSLGFLRDHPGYSSCRGVIAGVWVEPDPRYGELSGVFGKSISFTDRVYPPGSTLDATASQRVLSQLRCYRTNWYDVFRIEQLRASYQALRDRNTRDLILAQHIPHLLGNVAGTIHRDSYLYLVRQMNSPDSSNRTETRSKGDHFDRMLLETWSDDFAGFVDAIASAISEKDGIPVEEARSLVRQGYRDFMAPRVIGCLRAQVPPARLGRVARKMVSELGPVGRATRKLYSVSRNAIGGRSFVLHYHPGKRFTASHREFRPIYDFLTAPAPSVGIPPQEPGQLR